MSAQQHQVQGSPRSVYCTEMACHQHIYNTPVPVFVPFFALAPVPYKPLVYAPAPNSCPVSSPAPVPAPRPGLLLLLLLLLGGEHLPASLTPLQWLLP